MGALSPTHLIIIAALALLIFGGGGKISSMMGDAAKGVKAFKQGMKDDEEATAAKPAQSDANKVITREADG